MTERKKERDAKIIGLLERIADSLESLVTQQIREILPSATPFPWNKISSRTRNGIADGRRNPWFEKEHADIKWPWTCEDLMKIGFHEIHEMRRIGERSLDEIDQLMKSLGFRDWKP